jgi:hypothetical protein
MSRYYTNVTIPQQFDQTESFIEQIELLKFEKDRLNKRLDYLYRCLDNIPGAIEEFGFIDLVYDKNKHMKIGRVPRPNQPPKEI